MKKKIIGIAALVAAFGAGVAFADKTVVHSTANAQVFRVSFRSPNNGTLIEAEVCGATRDGGGNNLPVVCHSQTLPNGAFKTAVAGIFTGNGLTFWRTQEGL